MSSSWIPQKMSHFYLSLLSLITCRDLTYITFLFIPNARTQSPSLFSFHNIIYTLVITENSGSTFSPHCTNQFYYLLYYIFYKRIIIIIIYFIQILCQILENCPLIRLNYSHVHDYSDVFLTNSAVRSMATEFIYPHVHYLITLCDTMYFILTRCSHVQIWVHALIGRVKIEWNTHTHARRLLYATANWLTKGAKLLVRGD